LSRLMASLGSSSQHGAFFKRLTTTMLAIMGAMTVYPVVLHSLLPALEARERISGVVVEGTGVESEWKQFWAAAKGRAEMYQQYFEGETVCLCDNLSVCSKRLLMRPRGLTSLSQCEGPSGISERLSRQCSGCSSVIYCSERCQRMDWVSWHKSECPLARKAHLGK
jgi:hypothetical protein